MRHQLLNDGWTVRPATNSFAELVAGSAAEWEPVTLPHDAMISGDRSPDAGPASAFFTGGSWQYRRPLTLGDTAPDQTVMLCFEGIYRDAAVSINGQVVATRPNGYSTFYVPLSHLFRFGDDNDIEVFARSHDDSRWYAGAGIYRNVWLLTSGPLHLVPDGVAIATPEVSPDGAVVTVDAEVSNRSANARVAVVGVDLLDAAGEVVSTSRTPVTVFGGDRTTARQRLFVAGPDLWGPDHPSLYACRVTLVDPGTESVIDAETARFGIRSLSLDPRAGLRINGEPIKLRGACVHHDNGPLGAAAFERAERRRVEGLKAAGFNAIRSAHNPMSEAMLRACDELGVVVMDETFDMWRQQKTDDDYAQRFADWWESDVEALVRRDRNHPSVVLYSIGNEIPDGSTAQGVNIGRRLAGKIRALDDSRYVTQAVNGLMVGGPDAFADVRKTFEERKAAGDEEGVNTMLSNLAGVMGQAMRSPAVDRATTEAFAHLDVAGYNYMETRYAIDAELHPNRLVVGTETHSTTMDGCWSGVLDHPNVIGDFTWTGWDYLGEAGIGRTDYPTSTPGPEAAEPTSSFHGTYPWLTAGCSDIDIIGDRQPQSFYREILFGLAVGPAIFVQPPQHHGIAPAHSGPWSWPDVLASWTWDGSEGRPIQVEVYADADEVELILNGTSQGRQPVGAAGRRYAAIFELAFEPGTLEAVAFTEDAEVGRSRLVTATDDLSLRLSVEAEELRGDGADLAYVAISLVDAEGTRHPGCDRAVTISLEGPAVLQAFGSANPSTTELFADATHTTFRGRAMAMVRPTGAGTIRVTASADGCEPVTVLCEAHP